MKNIYTKEKSIRLSVFFSILQEKDKYTFGIIDIFNQVIKEKTAAEIEETLKDIDLNIIELRFENDRIYMYLENYKSVINEYF